MSLSSSNQFRKTLFVGQSTEERRGKTRAFLIHFGSTQSRADSGVCSTRTRFESGTPSSQATRARCRILAVIKDTQTVDTLVAAPGSFTVCSVSVRIVCSVAGVIQQEQLATDKLACASHHPQQSGSPAGAQPPGRRKKGPVRVTQNVGNAWKRQKPK